MKKRVVASLAVVAVGAVSLWAFNRGGRERASTYRLATLDRGSVESVVSATGTLSAVRTVEVGTQVSGIVSEIRVDFNDRVTRGQVIALIDPTLLEIAVRNAEAALERSQAQLDQAERNHQRAIALREQKILSETDFNAAEYEHASARATVKSAEVGREQARRNLAYATIEAPVSGTVVERDVDVGQTVAASLQAPKLFTIAEDLAKMQMLASVDESDIGQIRAGQAVRFTVQAWPDDTFTGVVRQVRLQSKTKENVVNYTVVVDLRNDDGRLLPGMTASVRFVVASARDALRAPNAALRLVPTEAMRAELPPGVLEAGKSRLFYLDAQGRLAVAPVRAGLTDGKLTEVEGPAVAEGLRVVTGTTGEASLTANAGSNPFQSSSPQSGAPPPPPGPGF